MVLISVIDQSSVNSDVIVMPFKFRSRNSCTFSLSSSNFNSFVAVSDSASGGQGDCAPAAMHASSRKAEKSPTKDPRHAVKYKIKPDANYVKGRASVSLPWWRCSPSLPARTTRIWPTKGGVLPLVSICCPRGDIPAVFRTGNVQGKDRQDPVRRRRPCDQRSEQDKLVQGIRPTG